jgi:hypothetical protein
MYHYQDNSCIVRFIRIMTAVVQNTHISEKPTDVSLDKQELQMYNKQLDSPRAAV